MYARVKHSCIENIFLLTVEAFQQTSKVREDVKEGIEKLQKHFDAVETYIEMYSNKRKVVEAGTALYITILKAIEDVIGYYTRHMGKLLSSASVLILCCDLFTNHH